MDNKLLEKLAELEHKQWACWTKYMLDKLYPIMSPDALADKCRLEDLHRWERQIKTKYKNLSEEDKEKDRIWARKVLDAIQEQGVSK